MPETFAPTLAAAQARIAALRPAAYARARLLRECPISFVHSPEGSQPRSLCVCPASHQISGKSLASESRRLQTCEKKMELRLCRFVLDKEMQISSIFSLNFWRTA